MKTSLPRPPQRQTPTHFLNIEQPELDTVHKELVALKDDFSVSSSRESGDDECEHDDDCDPCEASEDHESGDCDDSSATLRSADSLCSLASRPSESSHRPSDEESVISNNRNDSGCWDDCSSQRAQRPTYRERKALETDVIDLISSSGSSSDDDAILSSIGF